MEHGAVARYLSLERERRGFAFAAVVTDNAVVLLGVAQASSFVPAQTWVKTWVTD